jgi:transcriptional regulator with XRE-family HTH domain
MKKVSDYILAAKSHYGNPHMSDRELGERYGYSTSAISNARYGVASVALAMKLAETLGIDAGEVLLVVFAEREKPGPVQDALLAYAKKALALVPSKAVSALCAFAVALGMFLPMRDAQAFGGAGGIRTLDAGFAHILP